ncbi:erythromycin resistance leader peptide [Corynebacterium sp. Marseille-P4611]
MLISGTVFLRLRTNR